MKTHYVLPLCSLLLAVAPDAPAQVVDFVESATDLGIVHTWADSWPSGDLGAGVALEDFDHDGDLDVFVGSKADTPLKVFRNDGAVFTDVSASLALATDTDVKQVLFADLDDDGWRDLVLSTWIPNETRTLWTGGRTRLFRADGQGGFVERTDAGDLGAVTEGRPTGVAAGDYDRDGDLDLYVSNWVGGAAGEASRNRLLRNDGDLVFTEVAASLGVDDHKKSYQPIFTDLSGDGWPDIVVAEDKRGGMTYYESNGDGTFTDRTDASGLDGYLVFTGDKIDGMGITVGDADNDGDLDLYSTNIFDGNVFYRNEGDGTFSEVASSTGTQSFRVGWGCGFFDCDSDGWLDLYVANFGMTTTGNKTDRLYHNQRNGAFVDIAAQVGADLADDAFGMATGDLDGNGSLDVVVVNGAAPVRVLMAEAPQLDWIALALEGTTSNRDGVGARVELTVEGRSWVREQRAGTSYLSFDSHQLEFGLGDLGERTTIDQVVVRWPSGRQDRWTGLEIATTHRLVEGSGSVTVLPVPSLRVEAKPNGNLLTWTVDPAVAWDRFELWRGDASTAALHAELAAEPGRATYAWLDPAAGQARYRVGAWSGGERVESEPVAAAPAPRSRLAIAAAAPNPFNPRTVLRYRAPRGESVILRIVDGAGRTVRGLQPAAAVGDDGWSRVVWDGLDDRRRAVASGSYRFVVEAAGAVRSTPLTLVR